jgi:hypothetical protein
MKDWAICFAIIITNSFIVPWWFYQNIYKISCTLIFIIGISLCRRKYVLRFDTIPCIKIYKCMYYRYLLRINNFIFDFLNGWYYLSYKYFILKSKFQYFGTCFYDLAKIFLFTSRISKIFEKDIYCPYCYKEFNFLPLIFV